MPEARNNSEHFLELKEAIQTATDFITLVEELCTEDFTGEFGDLKNVTAEELESSEAAKEGAWKVLPALTEFDRVVTITAKVYITGEKGMDRRYHIGALYEIGPCFDIELVVDHEEPFAFENSFQVYRYIASQKPDTGATEIPLFKELTQRIRDLQQAGRLEKGETV